MTSFRSVVVFAIMSVSSLGFAQGFLGAEAVARAVAESGPIVTTSASAEASVELADLIRAVEIMAQCTNEFAQLGSSDGVDYLFVHGFAIVSLDAWRAQGARAVEPAIEISTLRAYAAAAQWFNDVRVASSSAFAQSNVETQSDRRGEAGGDAGTMASAWSLETVNSLARAVSIDVSDDLIGGQRLGHEVYSLGDAGLCVLARWSFPANQQLAREQRRGTPQGQGAVQDSASVSQPPQSSGAASPGSGDRPILPPGLVGGGFRNP